MRFAGKAVLVTGAGGGLGSVLASLFAQEGASVVLADVSAERGEGAAARIRDDGGSARFEHLDVTDPASWAEVIGSIRSAQQALHVLVNNAGVVSRTGIQALTLGEWERVLAINLTGPLVGIQACAPLIRDSGGGAIVNISSTSGLIGHPGAAYSASKWALRGLTKSAALEFLDWGIRVNSVHPAQISDTSMTSGATPGWRHANNRVMPAGRPARADEVAKAVLFLASDESSYVNATELVVDGGAVPLGLPRVRALLEQDFNKAQAAAGGQEN
jgi:3alpha(or 20beta)-hydroxysteroid dehydrogenase